MGDGHVFELVEEFFRPVEAALDSLFYAGVLYGTAQLTVFLKSVVGAGRTYFLPLGNYNRSNLPKVFGKWVVITSGTSGVGIAFANEVSCMKMYTY